MIRFISDRKNIDVVQWNELCQFSETATWFQTPSCYEFYCRVEDELTPYVCGVEEDGVLKGIILAYITKSNREWKQYFTRRAIIIGGPLLAKDITNEALENLLDGCVKDLRQKAIYIETRNFHDYSDYRKVFEECGFVYEPHLNFKVDTTSIEIVDKNLDNSRKRNIKRAIKNGVKFVKSPDIKQVEEFYLILSNLYKHKIKSPLFSVMFFKILYTNKDSKFLLVEYDKKIIGGVCLCMYRNVVYEWYVCGEDGTLKGLYPSSIATYIGLKYAAEHGYKYFDMMGAGKPNEHYGVRDFKARFGGKLVEDGRYLYVCNKFLYRVGKLGVKIMKKL